MADKTFHVSGRGVVELYHDNGDGTHSRVLFNRHVVEATDIPMQISGRAVTIKYHRNSDGVTHSEVIYDRASSQAGDRTMKLSGWGIKIKYRQMPDGTFAEVVWLGVSNQASDKIFEIPSRSFKIKYRNMGDGTYAQVLWADPSTRSSDKTYPISGRDVTLRYRDMGDGSFAEVVYIFSPAELFAAGERGVWYDPSDYGTTGTLFQDSAGTTRVTAVEQPVGLMLDKSKGLVLGSELVTNGDFSNGTTGWTAVNATISVASGELEVNGSLSTGRAVGLFTCTAGKTYKVTGRARFGTSSVPQIIFYSAGYANNLTFTNVNGEISGYFTPTASGSGEIWLRSGVGTAYFDNISVRELPGNHAFQSTSTSRPTLRARINTLTYSEDFSNAFWTKSNTSVNGYEITANPAGTAAIYSSTITAVAGINYTVNVLLKRGTSSFPRVRVMNGASTTTMASVVLQWTAGQPPIINPSVQPIGTWAISAVGDDYYSVSCTFSSGAETSARVWLYVNNTDNTGTVFCRGIDLRVANDGVGIPAYQRIAAATDYDTSGFPVYLDFCESFGGTNTDNSMLTNSIDFSGTDKVAVFAGVRKLSDAAQSVVAELSATIASNNGTFLLSAPNSAAANYNFSSKGTTQVDNTVTTYTAPITSVIAATGNISAPSNVIRINGAQAGSQTGSQGTGNYGNFAMYIGRRNNASLPASMRLYGLVVRGAATSDALIASTEAWVNGKTKAY